jgi:hypothetical protein
MEGDCLLSTGKLKAFSRRDHGAYQELAEKTEKPSQGPEHPLYVDKFVLSRRFSLRSPRQSQRSLRLKAFLSTKLNIVGTFQHCCDATAKFFLDCDQAQDQMTVAGEIVKMPGMDEYAKTLQ